MATYYSQGNGAWSTLSNWDTNAGGGGSDPASVAAMDDQTFIIQAGHAIEFDIDSSGWTNGINGLTITSHATTPGMLYAKYSADGTYYLKLKANTTIAGTNAAAFGRLLANSNGTWGGTGVLPLGRLFVIELAGTSSPATINAQYLDIALRCDEPTVKYVTCYGTKGTATFDAGTDVVTWTSHGRSNGSVVMFKGGTLPSPLREDEQYYCRDVTTHTFKVAYTSGGTAIDLTDAGAGTVEGYTGYNGSTDTVNVFEDVSANPQWVAGAFVVQVDTYDAFSDRDHKSIASLTSSSITFNSTFSAAKLAGARIWLISRNVSIRTASTVATTYLVNYSASATHGGVFNCEIRSTAAAYYSYAIGYGYGVQVGGVISGFSYGLGYAMHSTLTGSIVGMGNGGFFRGANHTIAAEAVVAGAVYGFGSVSTCALAGEAHNCASGAAYQSDDALITGKVLGGSYVANQCSSVRFNGFFGGNGAAGVGFNLVEGVVRGTVRPATYFAYSKPTQDAISYALRLVVKGDCLVSPGLTDMRYRNTDTGAPYNFLAYEDYGGVLGEHRTLWQFGDCIKNTTTIRSGGASSSIEVVPQSRCGSRPANFIPILEWFEHDVPASAQTRSIYIKGEGWTGFPTASELWIEAEYYNSGSVLTRATVASTTVLTDNTTWTAFSVSFTPGQVGPVRYRAFLAKYEAACKVYVDNMLVTS